ncbi:MULTISPECIES: molybdate ABC transporter substrate-binding protein [unclassified Polynucleobacter]|uniref:molybdate ABC transporter substrate-binding protein n=1 Tax=unclassified Polynucleobacter TaxID=2640945 RepID=UPI0008ADE7F9|nr:MULTISPECIES: molybdate ABC transporter substrate-binding protein [unclassified Polynucleobacter]OHC10053.1 MAG: molybdate ABC transporter substrate-binding protein [Polynucleobacter sp. GWA2_45_21]HBK43538.1 molybdate ABC transporter substrate-binding protein [Polynucleobacter sp.]
MTMVKSIILGFLSLFISTSIAQTAPTVAAASDLKFAVEEIAANYKADKGQDVKLVFGSSGVLWQQTKNGAPFSLLMSADEAYVDDLSNNGLTVDEGTLYAIGRIVLLQKKGSAIQLNADKDGLTKAIQTSKKIAIANPDHAPYGRAAKEYLISMGVWDLAQPKLVFGENISQATMFALTGSADFAISALSLASSPQIQTQSSSVLIPDGLHKPLKQKMALIKNTAPSAKDFYLYLQEPKSKQVMRRYGFVAP